MAKSRLTQGKKSLVLDYMKSRYAEKVDRTQETEAFSRLLEMVNNTIRSKFPEDEMVVLRKYNLSNVDFCLRFNQTSNGRFVGINFEYGTQGITDMPNGRGCRSADVFPASDELVQTFDTWQLEKEANDVERVRKFREYAAFVEACKTVEDVEEIVPLPADLRLLLTGSNSALVAVSDEIVADLRAEFALAEAA